MTEGRTPEGEPTPISEDTTATTNPPPLAPYVDQASAASSPVPAPAPAAPPPPIAWAAPPIAVAATGGRTTLAAIAGVGLIILGVLGGLFGLAVAVFGPSVVSQFDLSQYGDFGNINDPAAVISGALAFVGIIVVVYSLVYLIGGIGIVRSRGWGRVMGLIVGVLSGIFWLLSLSGGGATSTGNTLAFPLVMVAIHAYVVVVLIMFWKTKTA